MLQDIAVDWGALNCLDLPYKLLRSWFAPFRYETSYAKPISCCSDYHFYHFAVRIPLVFKGKCYILSTNARAIAVLVSCYCISLSGLFARCFGTYYETEGYLFESSWVYWLKSLVFLGWNAISGTVNFWRATLQTWSDYRKTVLVRQYTSVRATFRGS